MKRLPPWILPVLILGLVLSGCTTLKPGAREEQAARFQQDLVGRTAAAIPVDGVLNLDACIDIALANNLSLKMAEVDAVLGELDQDTAFANFLPKVQASTNLTNWSETPSSVMFGPLSMPMHDKTLRDFAIDIQMPIFVPAAWFLYSMRQHGAVLSQLAAAQVSQGIALQVTAKYYECLALAEDQDAQRQRVVQLDALLHELRSLHEEGMLSEWELRAAEAAQAGASARVRETERSSRQVRGELLGAMGLYPLAEIFLEPITPLEPSRMSVEDCIYQAMVNHPELHMADRQVAISEDGVKLAIADFLPQVMGFAQVLGSSNSRSVPTTNLLGGVSGVLSVFDGFANINAYRAAKQQREKAFLAREERCLALMTQVLTAYLHTEAAVDYLEVAALQHEAAAARWKEAEARWNEGMISASERLDAVAELSTAAGRKTNMGYQQQVSLAALRYAMGTAYLGKQG